MNERWLYDPEEHETDDEGRPLPPPRPVDNKCTPDKLLAFINTLGHMPTLQELKHHFGGILGPLFDGWTLQEQGRLPKFAGKERGRRR